MPKTGSQWPISFGMNKRSRQNKKMSLKFSAKKEDVMKKNNKRFSGISKLPNGNTSNKIVPGCIVLEGGAFRGLYT